MASSLASSSAPNTDEAASHKELYEQIRRVVATYPTEPAGGASGRLFSRHPDGWYMLPEVVVRAMVIKRHLKARDTDVFLASFPKCGATWLKALLYATLRRTGDSGGEPAPPLALLAASGPHQLVPFLEIQAFVGDEVPDLSSLPAPRLLATHIPSQSLPDSVAASTCKVVYLCRDPKDCFVSLWHFLNRFQPGDIDEALRSFCDGVSIFGPFWDHMLGYWRWHLEHPNKVLFLMYEELAADTLGQLRRLAEFIGKPFTAAERAIGADMEIVEACDIESLAALEINRSGTTAMTEGPVANNVFFRRGVVGDWKNHLTPKMARRIDEITESKLHGSGLVFPRQI